MSALFSPLSIGKLQLPNRIVIAPMCQYSAEAGCASDWHLIHLGQLAQSGAGLLIIEATAVVPEGRITAGDLGLYSDEAEAALGRVLTAVRRYSAMPIGIQLGHAGRKASSQSPWDGGALLSPEEGGWQTVAPSAIPHAPDELPPVALDEAGLVRVREAFVDAARRAARLGLDLIELHCAHGYLLHEFLSPLANQRTDRYGGSLENRARLVFEIIDGIRARCGANFQLGLRLSPERFGLELAEIVEVARQVLSQGKIDYLDMSLWDVGKEPADAAFQGRTLMSYFTELDRGQVRLGVAGKIMTGATARQCLENGADYVLIGRAAILHHDFPQKVAADPDFASIALPVTREHLRNERLGPAFIDYMNTWKGFVAQEETV